MVLGASGVIALGSLLPWASVSLGIFSQSVNGTSAGGDGIATLFLGLISAAAIGFGIWRPQAWTTIISLAAIGLTAVISVIDVFNLVRTSSDIGSFHMPGEVGIGLWLCVIASLVGLCVSIVLLKRGLALEPSPETIEINGKQVPVGKILYPAMAVIAIGILLVTHPWTTAFVSGSSSSKSSSASGDTTTTTTTGPSPQRLAVGDTAHFAETEDGLTSVKLHALYTNVPVSGDKPSSGKQFDFIDVEQCTALHASGASPTSMSLRLSNSSQVGSGGVYGDPQIPELSSLTQLSWLDDLPPGTCTRGWMPFAVPTGVTITEVHMTASPSNWDKSDQLIVWSVDR